MSDIQHISFEDIKGQQHSLNDYAGKVRLIVNVASKCGLTGQYAGLEQLYRDKKAQGLEILAFPCNDFLTQEPGTDEEIQQFCNTNYDVTFPVFKKISIVGEHKHPLYQALIQAQPERIGEGPWMKDLIEYGLTPNQAPEVLWNFEKFLLDQNGKVIARFAPDITADDERIVSAIDNALKA
ncbi:MULTISPECIES: glutathione peroxidase [unclassified Acinetobacter]|uniref:glutathione peroxidase n=1 Tax=unclassified Acinetobacter TaxID=196816 RepID=UPI0035B9B120